MLRPWLFVGFSGHRKLENPALIERAVREALQRLADRTQAPLAAVSSAAAGADTLFAEIVAAQSLPWTLLLPFPAEEFHHDFDDDPEGWARVEPLLPRAVRTVIEPSTAKRADAYLECGVRTVDESDALLAVWNGETAAGRGGTGDVVAYARSQEKPVIWVHAETGVITEERLDHLPAIIRSKAKTGTVAADVAPIPADKRTSRHILEETFHHHNSTASGLRPRAVNLNLSLVVLYLVSSAMSFGTLVFADTAWLQNTAGVLSIVFLAAAFVLPVFFQRAHREWMNHRLRAEICRSALAVWGLPRPEDIFPALRLPIDETWQRSFLLLRMQDIQPITDLAIARDTYDRTRLTGQLEYYRHNAARAASRHRWLKWTAMVLTFTAIFGGFAGRLHLLEPDMDIFRAWKLVVLVLPLIAAALMSATTALDLGRRAARYAELAAFLSRSRIQMQQVSTATGLTRVAVAVEKTLLLEIWEWYSLARFSPNR